MSLDLRRFVYPLDAHLVRLQWQRDAALGALAQAVARRAAAESALQATRGRIEDASRAAARRSVHRGLDPALMRCDLTLLAALQRRAGLETTALREAERAVAEARDALAHSERASEQAHRHRDDALADFRIDESRRETREVDQAWLVGLAARSVS